MSYERFALDRRPDGVLVVTMARPEKLNAMDQQWFAELTRLMRGLGTDGDTTRAVVLTGSGRAFSAGGDMAERVTVTYPRNLTYAAPGIGARETRVVELLGEPTTRETGRLTYECGTGPAPPRVTFVIENAAVSEVVFAFYVD